jgi:hypothetical protein
VGSWVFVMLILSILGPEKSHAWLASTTRAHVVTPTAVFKTVLLPLGDSASVDGYFFLISLVLSVPVPALLDQGSPSFVAATVYDLCLDTAHDLQSSAMDGIADPITSSRAYQEFKLLRLRSKMRRQNPHWGQYNPQISGTSDVWRAARERALENSDYMLFLASYERDVDPLPDHWMNNTGALRDAVAYLHPYASSAQSPQDLEKRHGIEREPIPDAKSRQTSAEKPTKGSGPGVDGQGQHLRGKMYTAILRRRTEKPT